MKTFRFSLKAVHELRESEEQAAQKVFAGALRAYEQADARLVMVDRSVHDLWRELRNSSHEAMRADQMRHTRSWRVGLEEQQKQLAEQLKGCQRQVDDTHQLLKAATQRRETLDRLLRKQRRAHEREGQHEDQKFLDELAARSAWRGAAQLETA